MAMLSVGTATAEIGAIVRAIIAHGALARADSGVSVMRQLGEMLWLRVAAGKLQPQDYYKLQVYRNQISFREKRRYMSNRAIPRILTGPWAIVASDKLLTYGLLSQFGIPVPRNHAVCHPLREFRDSRALRTVSEICGYLRDDALYPLIAKPVHGVFSKDVCLLERYDAASDTLRLTPGATLAPEAIANQFLSRGSGYLLQELLVPHRDIRESISDRICSLRIVVILDGSRISILLAAWKINAGAHVADNYWRDGNILAELDEESGRIMQCMTGLGPRFRTLDCHPTTGRLLIGFRVPQYREALDLVMRACRIFPGIPIQAWDVAITDAGPVPLEVNVVGSLFIPQLIRRRGLLTEEFQELVHKLCKEP